MEKVLKLYTYIDGVNDTPFPNEEQQVITSDFRSDYKRMGGVPTISCSIMHPLCLDKLWTDNVYATFNGEKFFIKQVPTSSYDNTDARYKHELELVSERIILDNVYVYDVVTSDTTNDKPVSNSSKFTFFGTIHEYAERLNRSLEYSGLDYRVVVDEGISSEGKMVSFENQFFSNAIQEAYNTYEIPYYFVGKVIHIGFTDNAITKTFKYGQDESLLSIQKQNANYKIVNRVTGVGSADNIPYYYPNDYESKEEVEANGGTWINPQTNLMPSIYRDTLGKERFYKALNDTYISPQTGTYYEFENPFIDGKPKEHIVNFEGIKPSIVGMTNSNGLRIDMFSEFAYDLNDNDETDEEGNYLHPYFFGKLRKFDGEYGFNLFDHAIDEDEMVISMTSGNCGACEFVIGVDEETQKNPVQVDSSGRLKRDSNGNVIRSGSFQDRQNDTQNYEVWIALKKDINTFGVIMPNATNNYKPSTNDTFVILHIDLPKAYILAAEDKLKEELIKYMAMNNSEKFNFSITFSRIFFAENPDILAQLNENARIQIEYDNELYELYVSSYSYNMSSDKPLPEIKVELSDTLTVTQNALQTAISEVKHDIMSSVGSIDWLQQGLRYFLRKDTNDRTKGKLSTDVAFEVGKYISGASGAIIYKDETTGQTVGELDKLYVRMKAYFENLEIINVNSIGGKQILSAGGSVKCIGVEETDDAYRCYFLAEQDGEKIQNRFLVYDQVFSQMFDAVEGVSNNVSTRYFWRLCTGVSSSLVDFEGKQCHYIDLSKTDADNATFESDVPQVGDILNHRGHRDSSGLNDNRMNFIEWSSVDAYSPSITLYHGVNSYSLVGKAYVQFGVDKTTNKAFMNVYGEMYVGDRNETSFMRYTQDGGLELKGKLSVGTKLGDKDLQELIDSATPEGYQEFVEKVTQDIEGLQNQIDGAIESYFYQYEPSLTNYPAMDWDTDDEKKAHLNDTFTNLVDGRSWRWTVNDGVYGWTEITDTATSQALALAGQAKDTADGKRRVFVGTNTPTVPYDNGDLWSRGSDYPLLVCKTSKNENQTYNETDWSYADNSEKIREELELLVSTTRDDLNNAIGKAKDEAVNNANSYTDEGQQSLQKSIDELNSAKANVNDVYTKSEADDEISKAEEEAIKAAKEQADAAIALSETIIKAYADGIVDKEEQARIAQAEANLKAAKEYADQKAQEAFNEIAGYEYLKLALGEASSTQIENGLVLTSLIQMRNTNGNVLSGLNGLYGSKNEKSIATWWGGDMHDLMDYYNWNGKEWVAKPNVTIPTSIPSGLIRFDGTGYFAKGKFWWDENGEIHADPTALLLSFDASTGDETLSSTIINIRKQLAEFMDMWEVKTLTDGSQYLYSKRHIATNGGITMYSNIGDLEIPNIYDGLPIDGNTIYWENGVLKSKGDGSGSTTKYPLSWSGFSSGSYDGSVAQSFYIPTKLSEFLNDSGFITSASIPTKLSQLTDDVVSGKYLSLSGGTLSTSGTVLTINKEGTNSPLIYFSQNNVRFGAIGFWGTDDLEMFSFQDSQFYKIWNSKNLTPTEILTQLKTVDGSGSGLDADTLDGIQGDSYARWMVNVSQRYGTGGTYSYLKVATITIKNTYNNHPITFECLGRGRRVSNVVVCWGNENSNDPSLSYFYSDHWVDYYLYKSTTSTWELYVKLNEVHGAHIVSRILYSRSSNDYSIVINNTGVSSIPTGAVQATFNNVASQLGTSRKIWGQLFDGSGDVTGNLTVGDGNLILNCHKSILALDAKGNNAELIRMNSNPDLVIGTGIANTGYGGTYIRGGVIYLQYGSSYTNGLILNSAGNVLIGTTTDSGYKLDVNGSIHTNSRLLVDTIPIYKSQDDVLYIDGNLVVRGGVTMYAENEVDNPSIIDSLPIASNTALGVSMFDSTYFSVDANGMVTLTSSPSSVSILSDLLDVDASVSGTATVDRVLYQAAGTSTWTWKELTSSGVVGDYLPLSGGTIINSNSSDVFVVKSTGEFNDWKTPIQVFTPDIQAGGHVNIEVGKSSSARNVAWFGLRYYGDGSYDNLLTMGLHSVDDVLIINGYGNVGIGTTSPSEKLHVVGNIYAQAPSTSNPFASINFAWSSTELWQISGRFHRSDASERGRLCTYYYNGSSWLAVMTLLKGGDMLVAGGITMYSDIRKKTKLQDVELSLKQIADAPLIQHYYNSDQDKTTHVGSIAQYWAGLNDWFCKLDNEGYYTMEIQNCALASAISIARHLERYESKTDKKIRKLQQRIIELEDEVERLKNN